MLEEVPAELKAGKGDRRWFTSARADLYVWQNSAGGIESFEYCYRSGYGEYSVRWHPRRGFEHACIDDGEASPFDNRTPISVGTHGPDWDLLVKHFRSEAQAVDVSVYRFILHKMLHGAFAA